MQRLPWFFFLVDFSFVFYWLITALHLIPAEYLYNDYTNPLLVDWNWSFLPLDLLVSFTGFRSMWLRRQGHRQWTNWALVSLVLTFASGLQALSFWVLRHDYGPIWWLPNGFLLVYPCLFIPTLLRKT